jgi:hypothetical protein
MVMTLKNGKALPLNTDVSLRKEVYERVRTEAKRRGIPITELVEQIIAEYVEDNLDVEIPPQDEAPPAVTPED